jgi:HPt (histidine-containing phosphotransfer) domain-containing protein
MNTPLDILLRDTTASPGNHALLLALLHQWGHRAHLDHSGTPPLRADAVLLDLDNGLDAGLALARTLAAPVVGMATCIYPDDPRRSQEAGLHALLAKPLVPARLREALNSLPAPVESAQAAMVFDYAAAIAQADPWIVGVIAQDFIEDWPRQIDALVAASLAADASTAQRVAHTLKGLAANFHAEPVVALARDLENTSAQCATPPYQQQTAALRSALAALEQALQAFCLAHPPE